MRGKGKATPASISLDFKDPGNGSEDAAPFTPLSDSSCGRGAGGEKAGPSLRLCQPEGAHSPFPEPNLLPGQGSTFGESLFSWESRDGWHGFISSRKEQLFMLVALSNDCLPLWAYCPLTKPNPHNVCRNCILTIASIMTHVCRWR